MNAVVLNKNFDLVDPHTKRVMHSVPAKCLFGKITENAYRNGEPRVLFLDTANKANPVPHLYALENTNPCCEQFLGPTRTVASAPSTSRALLTLRHTACSGTSSLSLCAQMCTSSTMPSPQTKYIPCVPHRSWCHGPL